MCIVYYKSDTLEFEEITYSSCYEDHERNIKSLIKEKVKCSRYRPGVAQRVGRGIALLFHDRGTRRG